MDIQSPDPSQTWYLSPSMKITCDHSGAEQIDLRSFDARGSTDQIGELIGCERVRVINEVGHRKIGLH